MSHLYLKLQAALSNGQDLSLLLARWILAYGFFEPAMSKWSDIHATALWFETLGIPLPVLNAYIAASTEIAGVILLTLGLFTRIIALPMIVVMAVAIFTVHLSNGFSVQGNGFEIPLYYMLFLMLFASFGAGKFSLDYLLFGREQ